MGDGTGVEIHDEIDAMAEHPSGIDVQPPAKSRDVARLAGVSPATVSRAFNTPDLLDPQTLSRVRDAASRLEYRPQGVARSLRSRRSLLIGVVIPSLRNTYFAETVERVQALLADRGYTVLIASSRYDPVAEMAAVKAMAAQGVDALLLVGRPLDANARPTATRLGVPTLRAWAWLQDPPCIGFDHDAAMREVTRHLLSLGHRRFALVVPFQALHDRYRSRQAAVQDALAEAGLPLAPAAVVDDGGFGLADGRQALRTLHSRGQRPTAVICSNDLLAAGVVMQAQAQGLVVPGDLSVSGYNDLESATAMEPALTTVSTPMTEHAARVVDALLALARGQAVGPFSPLPSQLMVRASTGRAPRD